MYTRNREKSREMDPNNTNPHPSNSGLNVPSRSVPPQDKLKAQQQAALDITRGQVERIYQGNGSYNTPHTTPVAPTAQSNQAPLVSGDTNELPQTTASQTILPKKQKIIQPIAADNQKTPIYGAIDYKPNPEVAKKVPKRAPVDKTSEQWKQYHSAWQNYYQKYYESYYTAAVKSSLKNKKGQPIEDTKGPELTQEDKKAAALHNLRKDISSKAKERSQKFRNSRHFVPIISAIVVVLLFVFLQYNRLFIANVQAYVSPGNATPQDTIYSPSASVTVGSDPKLIIPKINVDVPVIYGVGNDQQSQLDAMSKGVAHFSIPGANSVPGQIGNTVLSGHSSNDLFDSGDYKFIFAQLDRIEQNDIIYANYEGVRYTYSVTEKKVVLPTDVQSLIYPTDKPILTLITCTPLGTAEKRLLVIAEQISPDPTSAKSQSDDSSSSDAEAAQMPSNSPTFFERLFTWNWS